MGLGTYSMDDILADMLTLCDGVIEQKKDDWSGMSREQKTEWLNEFMVQNAHPVKFTGE